MLVLNLLILETLTLWQKLTAKSQLTSHLPTQTAGVLRTENFSTPFERAASKLSTVKMVDQWTARTTAVDRRPTKTALLT